ncbi:hypothetical protein KIH24_01120 [Rhizobiales bacterium TNE-4]|nr:hypothetical protein [Rhizobiales bacterium TNE-4]MBV1826217.1 hypothetical protein [Rhizobiales bacterium TNE-4]
MKQSRYKVGISTKIVDKTPVNGTRAYAEGFIASELTISEFINHVRRGYAFTAHFEDGYRRTENFVCSDFIAADIDSGLTVQEALGSPFIQDFATFLYTTPSHSEDYPRFRIVFVLEETITDANDWKNALLGLAVMLESDQSIKDAGRLFFGSKGCQVFKVGKTLPKDEVTKLIKAGKDARVRTSSANKNVPITSSQKIDPDGLVELSNGRLVPLQQLTNTTSVKCPFHLDRRSSAFVVRSSTGTLGIHCMTCRTSFWCDAPDDYDFDQFDHLIDEVSTAYSKKKPRHENFFSQFFPYKPIISLYEKQYLPPINYTAGITMVKSPKGSGKTEALKGLIRNILLKGSLDHISPNERSRSVLLIGHRRSLIQEAANKLDIDCYLKDGPIKRRVRAYSICLDSLHFLAEKHTYKISSSIVHVENPVFFDTIIIDESEQVFRHLLSETIADHIGIDRAYLSLKRMLANAKAIYALDADLGLITGHALKSFRPDFWSEKCRLIVNRPDKEQANRILYRYKSKNLLIQRMLETIREGKRCFVTSNSKKLVNILTEIINREFKSEILLRSITADNSQSVTEKDFVENIKSEFLKIQVLLCSPSLGTGIDITFPNNDSHVDEVFGFFYSHVNTHFDVDQQLSRVRNPGRVSVWISAHKNRQETNIKVIQSELVRSNWIQSAKTVDQETGETISDAEHPLVMIAAHMISSQRSSKKRMAYYFEKLRNQSGWTIEVVEQARPVKGDAEKEAKRSIGARRIKNILSAKDIDPSDYIKLAMAIEKGKNVSEEEKWQCERARLRYSYDIEVTEDLIRQDDNGKLAERISNFVDLKKFINYRFEFFKEKHFQSTSKRLTRVKNSNLILSEVISTTALVNGPSLDIDARVSNLTLKPFVDLCQKNRILIEESLNIELRDDMKVNPVRQLNAFLKIVGLQLSSQKRSKSKGKNLRFYGIDPSRMKFMEDLSARFVSRETLRGRYGG